MKKITTLLVDHGSETIPAYLDLFTRCEITLKPVNELQSHDWQGYDLVILSDGSRVNVDRNQAALDLLAKSEVPVIGICYGFQLMAYRNGAQIERLTPKVVGENQIKIKTRHPMFGQMNKLTGWEKHRFGVLEDSLPEKIICHATSRYGVEIIEISERNQFGFQFHPEIEPGPGKGSAVIDNLVNFLFNQKP